MSWETASGAMMFSETMFDEIMSGETMLVKGSVSCYPVSQV